MNRSLMTGAVTLALAASLASRAQAQNVTLDDFEGELKDWSALKVDAKTGVVPDPDSRVVVTNDAAQVKAGHAALSYSYDITPGVPRGLSVTRELNIGTIKSLHGWIKSSVTTLITLGISEKTGGTYQTAIYCPADTWQEVAINLDEFVLDNSRVDPNGRFDASQFHSLLVGDIASRLVGDLPLLAGSRTVCLDDFSFSPQPVPMTAGGVRSATAGTYYVDNFETPLIRWMPASIVVKPAPGMPRVQAFDAPLAIDGANVGGGKGALKFSYVRSGSAMHAILRNLTNVDLRGATHLLLKLRTSSESAYLISLTEQDGSRYQQLISLKPGDKWKEFVFSLPAFILSDGSRDENSRLDAGQIRELTIADALPVEEGAAQDATLWVDDVRFALGPR